MKDSCVEHKHLSSAHADSDLSRPLPQTPLTLRQGLYSNRLLAQTRWRFLSNISTAYHESAKCFSLVSNI